MLQTFAERARRVIAHGDQVLPRTAVRPHHLGSFVAPVVAAAGLAVGRPVEAALLCLGVTALADVVLPARVHNPDGPEAARLASDPLLRWLPLGHVGTMAVLLPWATAFAADPSQALYERILLAPVFGMFACTVGINVAHELIHRRTAIERFGGGLLLAASCYGTFVVEHIRGHHVHVATPLDPSSAAQGVSVWRHVPRAILGNVRKGFGLEAARLRKAGLPVWSRHNEALVYTGVSLGIGAALTGVFGPVGLAFFLAQALGSVASLEVNNYIEHYGLRRSKLPSGRYEPVAVTHSWCADHAGSDAVLLALPRHADHHTRPRRPFQLLRRVDAAPQLPYSYTTMYLLAMVPPAWFAVMDPAVARARTTGGQVG